jgi:VanZ family protein
MQNLDFKHLLVRCAQAPVRRWHIIYPLAMMALLFWLSSIPGALYPDDPLVYRLFVWVPPNVQNLLHVPVFGALGWLAGWALQAWIPDVFAAVATAFIWAAGYGVLDEWHQSFVVGRYASLSDVLLDVAGVALGLWLFKRARQSPKAVVKPEL